MKKIVLTGLIIFIILFNKEESVMVSNEISNEEFKMVLITVPALTTRNFNNYFSNIKVISIYPRINPIYKNKVGSLAYNFTYPTNIENINNFEKYYKKFLKKNNFINDLTKTDYIGIPIEKVKIYTNKLLLSKFMKSCDECVYDVLVDTLYH